MIYKIHPEALILEEISKLKPIPHNKFRWWRRFEPTTKLLHKRYPILEKINNGDYNFSHYFWQAQYALLEVNKLYEESPNYETWLEKSAVGKSRYKRLMEDYYKDEKERMERLVEVFYENYTLKRDQVKEIIETFGGTIKDLYIEFEEKYKYAYAPTWKTTIK